MLLYSRSFLISSVILIHVSNNYGNCIKKMTFKQRHSNACSRNFYVTYLHVCVSYETLLTFHVVACNFEISPSATRLHWQNLKLIWKLNDRVQYVSYKTFVLSRNIFTTVAFYRSVNETSNASDLFRCIELQTLITFKTNLQMCIEF